jgi:hypothetical protein
MIKKFFNPLSLAVFILAPLPLLLVCFHTVQSWQQLTELEAEAERISLKVLQTKQSNEKHTSFLAPLKHSDPQYLNKHVETLTFLLPEVKKIEFLVADNPENETLLKQLHHLTSGHNRLLFSENATRSNDQFKETELTQQQPVEMNEEDLKRLLCLIEGTTIWPYGPKEGRPLFLITDFKLSKQEFVDKEKVFLVSMQLLKREPL